MRGSKEPGKGERKRREREMGMKAGATILHAKRRERERENRAVPLQYEVVQWAYLNRDRRLRLIIATVRSRGAREKKK